MIKLIFMISAIALPASAQTKDFENPSLSPEIRVADLVSRMSVLEKISQLGNSSPALSGLGIKSYEYGNEALHGVVAEGVTVFPQAIGLSAAWDTALLYRVALAVSDEARALSNLFGKGLTYWAPTANMARDPRWGRNEETYGEDVYLAKKCIVNFIRGMQGNDPKYLKTIATVKHFACYNVEKNRVGTSSDADERSLREYYLPVFKVAVVEAQAGSIMSAYNALNGVPCSADHQLLTQILRKEWGFAGYVVSDCDAIEYICKAHHYVSSFPEAAAAAIEAGCDLCCGLDYQHYLPLALADRFLNQADIDAAVTRIFIARTRLGEFDPPAMVPYTSLSSSTINSGDHKDLALQAARESIVLLKNNGILPLDSASLKSIAVIGPNANICRFGGYSGKPVSSITPLQGIQNRVGDSSGNRVVYASGCAVPGPKDEAEFEKAISIARDAAIAIMFMGTDNEYVGEGRDLDSLNLPGVQEDLIKAVYQVNPNTVVVLINGNPLSIDWVQANVPGILEAWYAGQSQGRAIAEALFGDYNPGGKLTSTWVASSADLPAMGDYNVFNNRTYSYFTGTPLYPFGYGLSYTTFSLSNLSIEPAALTPGGRAIISVEVNNTGTRAGDDVVQLYVQNIDARSKTAGKRLKGFQRVSLIAGETKTVTFAMPYEELSFWDVAAHAFRVESGAFKVTVGNSSIDIGVSGQITVDSLPCGLSKEAAAGPSITRTGPNAFRIVFTGKGAHRADIIRPDGRLVFSMERSGGGASCWRPPTPGVYLVILTEGNSKRTRRVTALR